MTPIRIAGIVLLIAGLAALIVPRFTYTEETHDAEIGPISVSVDEKETVAIPTWAGIGAIVAGIALVAVGRRR
jgi:uncharacterized membrane protein HdeD (DUF308 family)